MEYLMTVGLEIHVEVRTVTKIFCDCPNRFGDEPNTNVCPVCMGLPGALPRFNRAVAQAAIRLGTALGCEIAKVSTFDRKNYFYPDNPCAYQITQYENPICRGGAVPLGDGEKQVPLERIHMEEDAGKLMHEGAITRFDGNRCGVPLLEIVSKPVMHSAEDAAAYVDSLREILTALEVSDCKMQNGSLRCDVNVSASADGVPGVPVEIKNINSVRFMKKAIEDEFRRQCEILSGGGAVERETRRFDEHSGKTLPMRKKETARDYRYFPEPDLPPLRFTDGEIAQLAASLPTLPAKRRETLRGFGLPAADAVTMAKFRPIYDSLCKAVRLGADVRVAAALLSAVLFPLLPPDPSDGTVAPLVSADFPARLAAVCRMETEHKINRQSAKVLLGVVLADDADPVREAERRGLYLISDPDVLSDMIVQVLAENAALADAYRGKEKGSADRLIGAVMKKTGGNADPGLLRTLVQKPEE